MKLGILISIVLAVATLGAFAPSASANQTVCAPGNAACVSTYGYQGGSGSCSSASSYYYQGSGVNVNTNANGQSTALGGYYGCYYSSWGPYSSEYVGVYYFSYGSNGYSYANAQWYEYSYGSTTNCNTYVYSYNMAPLPGYQTYGCPAGSPPSGLPLLP